MSSDGEESKLGRKTGRRGGKAVMGCAREACRKGEGSERRKGREGHEVEKDEIVKRKSENKCVYRKLKPARENSKNRLI